MSDTENQNNTEEELTVKIPDDIIAEMNAAETRAADPSVEPFTVPSTPVNDFLQIASGGGAIVESQAEWAAEGGILNNGFPTGIVLQEQYNKAWRQSTSWIRALGWHASQLIQQNVVDDGNSEKLWRQLYEAYLVQHVVFDISGTNGYTTPNTFGLTWTTPPRAGTEINLWVTNANTSTTCTLNFAGTGVFPIKHLDGTNPIVGDIAGHVSLSFSSSVWYIQWITKKMFDLRVGPSVLIPIIKTNSFGTIVDVLQTPGVFNYTVPAGCFLIQAILVGGGGGSSGSNANEVNGSTAGGGGAGCCITPPIIVTPGQVIGYQVGAGGIAVNYGATGGNGGSTTFSSGTYIATGGYGASFAEIGQAGSASGGLFNINGMPGAPYGTSSLGSTGGIGGTAGGPYGGGGGSSGTGNGSPGTFPGGGGGGCGNGGVVDLPGMAGSNGGIYILR